MGCKSRASQMINKANVHKMTTDYDQLSVSAAYLYESTVVLHIEFQSVRKNFGVG